MLGVDRRALRVVWTVFLFALTIAIVYTIRGALVTFTLALFFALMLSPLVSVIDHFTPVRIPRTVALTVVYVLMVGALTAILAGIFTAVASDARALSGKLPDALQSDPFANLPLPAWLAPLRERLTAWIHDRLNVLGQNALTLSGRALGQLASGLETALRIVLVPILAFFFIKDGKMLHDKLIDSVDRKHQFMVHHLLQDLDELLSQYLRALLVLSMVAFVSYSLFLSLTGARYAVLLAGIAATLEFIPAVGPLAAVLIIAVVCLFSGYTHWFLLLIFLVVYRLAQDYVLQPLLMSSGVRIHPLLIIFGVLAGGELGGIPGIFFSIPVIAALRLLVLRLWKQQGPETLDDAA